MAYKKQFVQLDGTPKTYNTSRQGETYLYITGAGDDLVNGVRGAGDAIKVKGCVNCINSKTIGFIDDIYLKDGIIFWNNAIEGDSITIEIILPANTMFVSPTNTGNYDIDEFGNVTPNTTNTGGYMMYTVDITTNRFINMFEIMGTNDLGLTIESSDTAFIPKQLLIKIITKSTSNNPDLLVRFSVELYREITV